MQQLSDAAFEEALQNEREFIPYIRLLKQRLHRYTIFISASDTPAGPSFPPEYAAEFMETFNLQVNLADKYRIGYAAIIDRGNVVFEQLAKDPKEPVVVDGTFNGKELFFCGSGYYCEWQPIRISMLMIDNKIQMRFGRGLSFAVMDMVGDRLVDAYHYDTFNKDEQTVNPFKYLKRLKEFSPPGGDLYFSNILYGCLISTTRLRGINRLSLTKPNEKRGYLTSTKMFLQRTCHLLWRVAKRRRI